ncbi:class I adenylate-forming enzyme family protein [Alicyclobacillus tolerans]|uniref:Long-chain acyl-CoA synthetase n=1 Tax=Alicyclobacillus tolerans TaxID=90970 RepID=A0A1M6QJY1_9BACL|nr:AMP-binding protein [Alicyclobacillus montanus]SHK20430.1 long-chain acyl-CoA synthetase [Alicyclobacillus montanus]
MHLSRLLEQNVETYGEYTSLIYEGQSFSNLDHLRLAQGWAQELHHQGVDRGDTVLVSMPNRPEVFFVYSAIAMLGAITVPVMPLLQGDEILFIARDCQPKVMITCEMMQKKLENVAQQLNPPPKVLAVERHQPGKRDTAAFTFLDECKDEDIGVILYTSGTTGQPKGVELTHNNLVANAQAAAELAKDYDFGGAEHVGLLILPLSHAFGYTMMNVSILRGERNIMLPHFDPLLVLQAIQTYRVTHFSAVPAMFHALLHHPERSRFDVTSLALCISGSAPLPVSEREQFEQAFDCVIFEGYGLSEAAPIVTAPRFNLPVKPGSVGLPLPGVEVRVVNEQGQFLPNGDVGELIVKGPNVTRGYHGLPEITHETLRDGWLYTGDVGYMDSDGYVFVVDRKKDVIIRGGFNIYPRDLEDLLIRHPAVLEAAVIGVPSEAMGEEVMAFIVKRPGIEIHEETLLQYCQKHLAKYKTPRWVKFIPFMPKNVIGKIDRKRLKTMWSKQDEGQVSG